MNLITFESIGACSPHKLHRRRRTVLRDRGHCQAVTAAMQNSFVESAQSSSVFSVNPNSLSVVPSTNTFRLILALW